MFLFQFFFSLPGICNDEQLKTVLPKLNHETKITEEKTDSEVIGWSKQLYFMCDGINFYGYILYLDQKICLSVQLINMTIN